MPEESRSSRTHAQLYMQFASVFRQRLLVCLRAGLPAAVPSPAMPTRTKAAAATAALGWVLGFPQVVIAARRTEHHSSHVLAGTITVWLGPFLEFLGTDLGAGASCWLHSNGVARWA
jgi:hypothetical protein